MRRIAFVLALALTACSPAERTASEPAPPPPAPEPATTQPWTTWPADLPVYDHIVIVVEENKDWADIIDNPDAPYINETLRAEGALLTESFGLEHHSQGNYYWLFSGDNQGVGFDDKVPADCSDETPYECENNQPFSTSNLAMQLHNKRAGLSFKGYSESLPAIGSTVDRTKYPENERVLYARKHVPWISFSNVPNGTTVETSSNLRFIDFPSGPEPDFHSLPTISFVIPDLENDMHNLHELPPGCVNKGSVCVGDTWLRDNLDTYYQWAKENNSLLIFTFDEDNGLGYQGLTDPFYPIPEGKNCKTSERDEELQEACGRQNRVVTIFAGAHIIHDEYPEGDGITHVNILRTIEAMYGLPKSGAQQVNAVNADGDEGSITDDAFISDVFQRQED